MLLTDLFVNEEQIINDDTEWTCVYDRFTSEFRTSTYVFNDDGRGIGDTGEVEYNFVWTLPNRESIVIAAGQFSDEFTSFKFRSEGFSAIGSQGNEIVCSLAVSVGERIEQGIVNPANTYWLCSNLLFPNQGRDSSYIFNAGGSGFTSFDGRSNPSLEMSWFVTNDNGVQTTGSRVAPFFNTLIDIVFDDFGNFTAGTATNGSWGCVLSLHPCRL